VSDLQFQRKKRGRFPLRAKRECAPAAKLWRKAGEGSVLESSGCAPRPPEAAFLGYALIGVARRAERIVVALVPEQAEVAFVGDGMSGYSCRHQLASMPVERIAAERVRGEKMLAVGVPSRGIALPPSTRPPRLMTRAVCAIRDEGAASSMGARMLGLAHYCCLSSRTSQMNNSGWSPIYQQTSASVLWRRLIMATTS